MTSKVNSVWRGIVNIGVSGKDDPTNVQIQMMNRVYLYSSFFSFLYFLYLMHIQHYVPAMVVFGMASTCLSLLFVSHLRLHNFAKILYTIASNFCIYYFTSYLGMSSGVHLYVMLAPVIILSFFDLKETAYIVYGMGIYILTFLFIMEVKIPFTYPENPLTPFQQHVFYVANVFFIFILSTVLIVFLLKSNRFKNDELLKKRDTLLDSQKKLEAEIREHKVAKEIIRLSESRLTAALEAARQGLWDLNLITKKLYYDKIWLKIMDLDEAEIKDGLDIWLKMIPPDQMETVMKAVNEHLNGASTYYEAEYQIRTKSGELKWLLSRGKVTERDVNGNAIRMMGTIQDISAQKEFEKELQRSKEAAEEASLAKAQFLSIMSHEIRTPLNAVIGTTYLLLQENPRPDQLRNLELLKLSSENLLLLINNILDFNKIDAKKVDFEETDFHLRNLIQSIVFPFQPRAEEKRIDFITNIDNKIPDMITGDPTRLGQILSNLLSNAIKFTDVGKVELECKLIKQEDNKVELEFVITDTGIGISSEKLELVFNPFTQENSSITRRFGGTGLGLSITQKLVRLLGSEIKVKSEPGKGSVFNFTLKFKIAAPKNNIQAQGAEISLNGLSILLVEDNEMNQFFTKKILENFGVEVEIASNGLEALEKILLKNYDLILMDLQMPEMDGFETTARIRAIEGLKFKKIPIIALTAEAFTDVQSKAIDTGFTDYITKPYNPKDLYSKIAKYTVGVEVKSE